jgi:putative FmdB family regulatory protein
MMPTYDYKCMECSHTFEIFQPMSAEHIKQCPNCNGKVRRLIGAGAGTIFKGSGFYHTDYKNSGSKEEVKKKEVAKPVPKPASDNAPKDAAKS